MKKKNIVLSLFAGVIGSLTTFGMFYLLGFGSFTWHENSLQNGSVGVSGVTNGDEIVRTANYSSGNIMMTDGALETDMVNAATKSVDAVVHVKTAYMQQYGKRNPLLEYFYGNGASQYSQPVVSSGSGVIVTTDGYIITNNHVIDKAQQIKVVLNDKREFNAELVGTDPGTDIALLKIKEENLPFIKPGNSDNVQVGEWVMAVGNPFNLTSTVTAGIVSAKARNINLLRDNYGIESFIQTDAAVNPGNSGGALVNRTGELIGINTAIASRTGSFAGYSFAVPVNIAMKVVEDLIEYGQVQRAVMGIAIRDLSGELAKDKNINTLKGVLIEGVNSNGAADMAGIESDDVIVRLGTIEIDNVAQLQEQLSKFRPGDKLLVAVLRDNKEVVKEVVLQNRIGNTEILTGQNSMQILGATFEPLSEKTKEILNIDYGLKISALSSGKLVDAGIHEGFIILAMNGIKIVNESDVEKAIKTAKRGVMVEGIYPNGMKAYYAFGM